MRWQEIVENASSGATSAGSVATVAQPLGMVSRTGASMLSGKYTSDPTPNTPSEYKRKKPVSGRKFQNGLSGSLE